MRFGTDLRTKALLALEDVCADCRFRAPPRTYAVRFALAYLWSISEGRVEPFVTFWREIADTNEVFRWRQADAALARIYSAVGAPRDEALMRESWRVAQAAWKQRGHDR